MKALKFNLNGKTAFFKKPDVNSYLYFTYGCIHKIALLGIIGSCLGLGGYNQQKKDDTYPEFYEKLKDVKVSIVPKNRSGYVNKKVQTFNNSVGYASKEAGGNLVVKEQWLESPSWDIYIAIDESSITKEILERFLEKKFKFIPYLGKNDHIANISDIELIEDKSIVITTDIERIDSIYCRNEFEFSNSNTLDNNIDNFMEELFDASSVEKFKYEEKLPFKLDAVTNQYLFESFIFTNMKICNSYKKDIYEVSGLNLYFF